MYRIEANIRIPKPERKSSISWFMSPTSGLVLITCSGGSKLGCIIPVDVLNNHGDRKSPKDPVVESLPKWPNSMAFKWG